MPHAAGDRACHTLPRGSMSMTFARRGTDDPRLHPAVLRAVQCDLPCRGASRSTSSTPPPPLSTLAGSSASSRCLRAASRCAPRTNPVGRIQFDAGLTRRPPALPAACQPPRAVRRSCLHGRPDPRRGRRRPGAPHHQRDRSCTAVSSRRHRRSSTPARPRASAWSGLAHGLLRRVRLVPVTLGFS